jgi:hypothetical protein
MPKNRRDGWRAYAWGTGPGAIITLAPNKQAALRNLRTEMECGVPREQVHRFTGPFEFHNEYDPDHPYETDEADWIACISTYGEDIVQEAG